uniref:Protein CNPPD1 n=1 Tax=Hirondellea gigas TaxID=1518452 RepID=A0A6A7GCF6_9CRUS
MKTNKLVSALSCVLTQLCRRNDLIPFNRSAVTKFHALRAPDICIHDYLVRISRYSNCSPECFILALIYIDRLIKNNPQFALNSLNVHRILITGIMTAAKFFDDQYYNNVYYGKVGGVPAGEINTLELEFLFMINFSLYVSSDEYDQYLSQLSQHSSRSSCICPKDIEQLNATKTFQPQEVKGFPQSRSKCASNADIQTPDESTSRFSPPFRTPSTSMSCGGEF